MDFNYFYIHTRIRTNIILVGQTLHPAALITKLNFKCRVYTCVCVYMWLLLIFTQMIFHIKIQIYRRERERGKNDNRVIIVFVNWLLDEGKWKLWFFIYFSIVTLYMCDTQKNKNQLNDCKFNYRYLNCLSLIYFSVVFATRLLFFRSRNDTLQI